MLEAMRNFIQVVDAGSFSQASKTLRKNASSVARQIDKLEAELGTQLFCRSTRRLELTLSGQSFYQQSIDILNAVQNAKQSVKHDSKDVSGTVVVSVFDSFGRLEIAPLLPKFNQLYPSSKVALSLDNSVVDLYNSDVDICIRHGKPNDSNLIMKPLVKDQVKLVASPKYIDENKTIEHPDDLKNHNCLTFHRQRQHAFWHFKKDNQQLKVKVAGRLSSCGGEPMIQWAKEGIGLTLMSHWCIKKELESGELIEVMPEWRPQLNESNTTQIYMVWPPGATQRPVVRHLIDFISERIRRNN